MFSFKRKCSILLKDFIWQLLSKVYFQALPTAVLEKEYQKMKTTCHKTKWRPRYLSLENITFFFFPFFFPLQVVEGKIQADSICLLCKQCKIVYVSHHCKEHVDTGNKGMHFLRPKFSTAIVCCHFFPLQLMASEKCPQILLNRWRLSIQR